METEGEQTSASSNSTGNAATQHRRALHPPKVLISLWTYMLMAFVGAEVFQSRDKEQHHIRVCSETLRSLRDHCLSRSVQDQTRGRHEATRAPRTLW